MEHHHELHQKLDINRVLDAAEKDENTGFCLACGTKQDGVEPDAQHVKCHHCHLRRVYGAQEIILQGLLA